MTLAAQLRQIRAELAASVRGVGASTFDAQAEIDSLLRSLDQGAVSTEKASTLRSFVGESIFEAIERYGWSPAPRDLHLVHRWVVAGLSARIAELTEAHESVARVDERLRIILPNARINVVEIDRDLRICWMYDARRIDAGRELIGLSLREIDEPVFAEMMATIVERVIRTGCGERAEFSPPNDRRPEFAFAKAPDHVLAAFEPIRDASGAISRVLVAATEVTELKQAQLELAQSVAFREQMLAILAHDLRNPLSSVLGLARLYARNEQVLPSARRAFAQIDLSSQRMVELIATLLDFSAIRFGQALPVSRVDCALDDTARAVVDELRGAEPERIIELRIDGSTRGHWDTARLAQVMSNLVGNALAHGAAHEPVRMCIDGSDQRVLLRVENRGPVIPAERLPTLFEPFRRGDSDAAPRGLGLGLYIVREIVKAHGGEISVESSVAGGTVFSVDLPRFSLHEGAPPPGSGAAAIPGEKQSLYRADSSNRLSNRAPTEPALQAARA